MSGQNVDTLRAVLALVWGDRDFDAALKRIQPDAVFDWTESRAPYSGRYRGHDEVRKMFQGIADAWEEWNPGLEEVIELDPDTVVIVTFVRARGKGSGVPVEARGASLWSFRDGKIARGQLFQSKADALAATASERGEAELAEEPERAREPDDDQPAEERAPREG